ncbi:MAG TPA: hypothetical protein VMU19_06210 [Bryobacteraceae bacterium]|nr:hypothetical protein [Bryobacteraceae bacterium]
MRILFIAADRMEFSGALTHTSALRDLPLRAAWARAGRIGGHDAVMVANGAGAARAAAALEDACSHFHPEIVVNTGFCGALDPSLAVASVVVATQVIAGEAHFPALPVRSSSPFSAGPVCSIDRVAQTAAEKRGLRATGACAVEMEAAGVAAAAQARGLPFYCIRTVTDLAEETLRNDFNQALRRDGRFDTMSILTSALRHPAARLPELVRLRKRCALASQTLGSFFANCNF